MYFVIRYLNLLLRMWPKLGALFVAKYIYFTLLNIRYVVASKSLAIVDKAFIDLELIEVKIGGKIILYRGKNLALVREILILDCYGFDHTANYEKVLDLGANVGVFTIFASKFSNFLVSVEMNKVDTHDEFLDLINLNDVKNVKRVYARVSNLTDENGLSIGEIVNTYGNFDFCKIDIEGAENDVFDDSDWLKSIKNLSLEVHPCFGVDLGNICEAMDVDFEYYLLNQNLKPTSSISDIGYLRARYVNA